MSSTEDKAYEIMRELDVDYVLVIFGGLVGYASDGKIHKLNHSNCTFLLKGPVEFRFRLAVLNFPKNLFAEDSVLNG